MEKIVVLDGHALNPGDLDWQILAKENGVYFADLDIYERSPADLVIDRAKDATVIVVNKIDVTKEVIQQLPKLKLIAITATGTNNIDIAEATERGILVKNVIGYSSNAVAQHVFALILALSNKIAAHSQTVHQLDWSRSPDFSYFLSPWNELNGKTLGIFGLGNIGQKVAEIGLAFGMKVIAHNRSNDHRNLDIQMVTTKELLRQSDILSLHAPLNKGTKHFINTISIASMKPNALLINTARGALINEDNLAQALKNQIIKGAGLDVLVDEPPCKDNPLFGLQNCIITPHIAWTSTEARTTLLQQTAKNIKSALGIA